MQRDTSAQRRLAPRWIPLGACNIGLTWRRRLRTVQPSWKEHQMYARQALENAKKPAASGLKPGAQEFPALRANDSFRNPPPFEKPVGNLAGACSRRIDIQHRNVHEVFTKENLPPPACIARLRTQALPGTRLHFLESP
jgi:Txe/YoeB family toxin of Txe-Axe toxin-antitoxin module